MAPSRTRKQDMSMSSNDEIPNFPAPPTSATKTTAQTPESNSGTKMTGITQVQKQALIDNLQLEITERARKLRAQCAMQAQSMRVRLEMRVNRIPSALRKRNMQELMDEHTAKAKPASPPPPPMPVSQKQPEQQPRGPSKKALKRKSDGISTGDDKENIPSNNTSHDLDNPKKRTKTAVAVANSKATRTASRKAGPAGVLSPKSHNSRTYPQSPLKPPQPSPEKAQPARPMLSAQSVATKPTARAPSRQMKRAAFDGRTSGASNTSSGTTVVTKAGTRKVQVPKNTAPVKRAGTVRKTVAPRADPAPAAGAGRTLRKRN